MSTAYWSAVETAGARKTRYLSADIPNGSHLYTLNRSSVDVAGGKNYSDIDLISIRSKARRAAMSGTVGPMICNARILDAVGDGVNPIPSPPVSLFGTKKDYISWKNLVNYGFQDFISNPVNVDGITSFVADLWEMVATCILDGDCFVRIMFDPEKDKDIGCGLCWRIIPGASVCNKDKLPNTGEWANGIKYNKYGRAVAVSYAVNVNGVPVWREVPIYGKDGSRMMYYIKLPLPNFFGSGFRRGLPLVANVIDEINIVDEYRRAALSKVASENNIVGAVGGVDEGYDDFTLGEDQSMSTESIRFQKVGNGTFLKLRGNERITTFNPSSAAVQYPDFALAMIEEICAATGTSPEIARMLFGGSYSGSMAGRNISSKRQDADRTPINFLISDFYRRFLLDKVTKGEVQAAGFVKDRALANQYSRLQIAWTPNGAINPLMQSRSAEIDIKSGITTREMLCAERGLDYQEVMAQRLAEAQAEAELDNIKNEVTAQ